MEERAFSTIATRYTNSRLTRSPKRRIFVDGDPFTCDFELRRSGDDGADAVEGGHALVHSLVGAVGAGVKHGGEVEGPVRQQSPGDQARVKSFPINMQPSLCATHLSNLD